MSFLESLTNVAVGYGAAVQPGSSGGPIYMFVNALASNALLIEHTNCCPVLITVRSNAWDIGFRSSSST